MVDEVGDEGRRMYCVGKPSDDMLVAGAAWRRVQSDGSVQEDATARKPGLASQRARAENTTHDTDSISPRIVAVPVNGVNDLLVDFNRKYAEWSVVYTVSMHHEERRKKEKGRRLGSGWLVRTKNEGRVLRS